MKLAIGTAQWGMRYGINNFSGIINDNDIKKINSFSKKEKIHMIDTATGYGNSEQRIGRLLSKEFNVVSKFGNLGKYGSINEQLDRSLFNLDVSRIYAYLFHDIKDLISNLNYWDELKLLKDSGKISKIGYSLYEPEELEYLIQKNCIPDIIQLPFNIFDRKFLHYFPMLKKMNTEIHVRSIFLQGLLFKDSSSLTGELNILKRPLEILNGIAKEFVTKIHHIAIQYPISIDLIDYVVVGLDNAAQLQEIVEILNRPINNDIFKNIEEINLNEKEKKYLNPSNWQIK